MPNLYFYVIKIKGLETSLLENSFKKSKNNEDEKVFLKKDDEDNYWILTGNDAPVGQEDYIKPLNRIQKTVGRIKKILESECENISFQRMLFGIHGSDWGIKGDDYAKGDIFFPQSQSIDEKKYEKYIKVTNISFADFTKKYQAKEYKVKLFSHGNANVNAIWQLFTNNIKAFLTEAKQQEIFSINHDVSTDKEDAKNQKNAISFTTTLLGYDDIGQLDSLETLFFQFRVCLTALKAISGEKDKPDLINHISDELKFLLEGGDLVRRWEEELTTRDGSSLKPNQFTEKCKVFGIGHYLYIFKKDTQIIEDCVNNFSSGSADDVTELIEKLDNVEKAVQEVIENQRKEPGYEG